jgi:glycosyltransferase involved in cell wall biosynthesis
MLTETRKPLKIAFLTALTLQNERSSWRLSNEYMTQALQRHCGEVVHIGSIKLWEVFLGKVLNKASQVLLKKRFIYYHSFFIAKRYARIAAQRLARQAFDVIVAPAAFSEIAFLDTDIPIVLIEGGTLALLHNYYSPFSNPLKRSLYEANTLQKLALWKASLVLNPSDWASRSVIEDYHIEQQKVHVLPYGANIQNPPPLEVILSKQRSNRCRLLFVGVEWQRKGGDIAFDTLLKLEEIGIQAELIVCGCIPPSRFSHERMTVIPYLNKNDKKQYKELENLFMTADFFFLPTRQELFGFVFSEASAFGLPVITTNTGGVPGAIKDGENGFMLPLSAGSSEYAEVIARIYQDDLCYAQMVKSSRAAFDERLNWDAWAIAVNELIIEVIESKKNSREKTMIGTSEKSPK